jgi:hypothetical protein
VSTEVTFDSQMFCRASPRWAPRSRSTGATKPVELALSVAVVGLACALTCASTKSLPEVTRHILSGRVLDRLGRPLPRARIEVSPSTDAAAVRPMLYGVAKHLAIDVGGPVRFLETDLRGAFEVRGLSSGPYVLSVFGPDGRVPLGGRRKENAAQVTLVSAEERKTITLQASPCVGVVSGVVLDSEGTKVGGVLVTAQRSGASPDDDLSAGDDAGEAFPPPSAVTDASGRFRTIGLCIGPHLFRARSLAGNRRPATAVVESVHPGDVLSLRLAPAVSPGEDSGTG